MQVVRCASVDESGVAPPPLQLVIGSQFQINHLCVNQSQRCRRPLALKDYKISRAERENTRKWRHLTVENITRYKNNFQS